MTFSLTETHFSFAPAIYKGFPIPQVKPAEIHISNVFPPAVRVIDVFFQCLDLGDLMLDALQSRLALPQRENSLEITSGIPTTEIIVCRKFLMDGSF